MLILQLVYRSFALTYDHTIIMWRVFTHLLTHTHLNCSTILMPEISSIYSMLFSKTIYRWFICINFIPIYTYLSNHIFCKFKKPQSIVVTKDTKFTLNKEPEDTTLTIILMWWNNYTKYYNILWYVWHNK